MKIGWFLFAFCIVLPIAAQSASVGVVTAPTANVRSEPSTRGEVLVKLARGQKINVLERRGDWLRINVRLDPSFAFDGWVFRTMVKWSSSSTPQSPPRAPTPPTTSAAPGSDLDQFFEPAPTPPREAVAPSQVEKTSDAPPPAPPPQRKRVRRSSSSKLLSNLSERSTASAGLAYLLYHYGLETEGAAPGELFAYNLSGIGIDLEILYWLYGKDDSRFRFGTDLKYVHGLYFLTGTDLQDSTGTTFSSRKQFHMSYDAWLRILADYEIPFIGGRKGRVGLSGGFQYFRFAGDDIDSDSGPLRLYVTQQIMGATAGVFARLPVPLLRHLVARVGADVMMFSMVKESPANASGSNPKGSMAYIPSLALEWSQHEVHQFELGYQLRYQTLNFEGNGTRVNTAVTDGSASTAVHSMFFRYNYLF